MTRANILIGAGATLASLLPILAFSDTLPPSDRHVLVPDNLAHCTPPKWQNGRLLAFEVESATVIVHDRDGNLIFRTKIILPDAFRITANDFTASAGGMYAASVSAYGPGGEGIGGIVWIDEKGSMLRFVRTSPFGAIRLCFSPDGTLWAFGREHTPDYHETPSYNVLHQYGADGKLLKTAVPRETFGRTQQHPAFMGLMVALPDGIGVYSPLTREYLELSSSGGTAMFKGVENVPGLLITGLAALPSGTLYLSAQQRENPKAKDYQAFYRFDRKLGSWSRIDSEFDPTAGPVIQGADGGKLVVWNQRSGTLSWIPME